MSDTKSKPREFWILNDGWEVIVFNKQDVEKFRSDFNSDGRYVHVVEYSALEQERQKVQKLREALADIAKSGTINGRKAKQALAETEDET